MADLAALMFTFVAGLLIIFHVGCAAGRPWGHLTQGGFYDGTLPTRGRILAGVQAALLLLMILVVRTHAGVFGTGPFLGQTWFIWVVVAICAMSFVANVTSKSAAERLMGVPLTIVMALTSWMVAYFGPVAGASNA